MVALFSANLHWRWNLLNTKIKKQLLNATLEHLKPQLPNNSQLFNFFKSLLYFSCSDKRPSVSTPITWTFPRRWSSKSPWYIPRKCLHLPSCNLQIGIYKEALYSWKCWGNFYVGQIFCRFLWWIIHERRLRRLILLFVLPV